MAYNIRFTKLDKENVLKNVSQESIFASYMNLPFKFILDCVKNGTMICSPIREDHHPTCKFYYTDKGKLIFHDFAGYFTGDCFSLVAYVLSNLHKRPYYVTDKSDFIKILRHITITFKDVFYGCEKDIAQINRLNNAVCNVKHTKPLIELVIRNWEVSDLNYWKQFGISAKLLNLNFIYPIDQYYVNRRVNPMPKYYYNKKDPCYGYFCGINTATKIPDIKLYFPKRKHNEDKPRFLSNFNHLEGIYNLDGAEYDTIVVTKSTKDRLALVAVLNKMKLDKKIGVINIPNEVYRLRQNEFDWLNYKVKDDGWIVSLMDNDRTGKMMAIWLRNNYHIIPLLIPKEYNCKDFAELRDKFGFKVCEKVVQSKIEMLKVTQRL